MADVSIIEFFYSYPSGFLTWLYSLTWLDVLLITSFTVAIDILRNIGKVIVLAADAAKKHLNPVPVTYDVSKKITILVPAHNESAAIRKTVQSIIENNYPNKEIIVIDDHSTDDTYQQVLPFHERGKVKLVKRMEGKGSKSAAINYGVVFATGDYLMVMDGDTLIERTALTEAAKCLSQPDVIAVSGNVRILSGDGGVRNLLTMFQSYEYLIAFELGRRYNALMNMLIIVPGAFGVFEKRLAKMTGLYDKDTLGEDFDLSMKLLKTGGRLEFAPKAIAWTYCPSTWKAWARQRLRWHHGQIAALMKHRDALKKQTFRRSFVMAFYDMIIMDVVLLLIRLGGYAMLALYFTETLPYVYTLLYMMYFANEFVIIGAAAAFSSNKSDLKYAFLAPLVVAFYRPFYTWIRFYAYIKRLLGSEQKW